MLTTGAVIVRRPLAALVVQHAVGVDAGGVAHAVAEHDVDLIADLGADGGAQQSQVCLCCRTHLQGMRCVSKQCTDGTLVSSRLLACVSTFFVHFDEVDCKGCLIS